MGSLLTALVSYIDAKQHRLDWLIRIEDTDLERCCPAYTKQILEQLTAHGLTSPEPTLIQSARLSQYQAYTQQLLDQSQAYYCQCTRKQIQERKLPACAPDSAPQQAYDGFCRDRNLTHGSIRFKTQNLLPAHDLLQGRISDPVSGDPVLIRANGIVNYVLSTAVDDSLCGIDRVIRGIDLIDMTPIQLAIQSALSLPSPAAYGHLPVLTNSAGQKLSKQNKAQVVDPAQANQNLVQVLTLLGLSITPASTPAMLAQATEQFELSSLTKRTQLGDPTAH